MGPSEALKGPGGLHALKDFRASESLDDMVRVLQERIITEWAHTWLKRRWS